MAKKNANVEPEKIITDKLRAYPDAISSNFQNTKHYRYKGFKDEGAQNNKIERFHGTFRERDKVMRGLNSVENAQAYAEAFRNYYNFIRPHSALNGLTPAQAAGIGLEPIWNRWLSLLKQSLKE